MAARRGVFVVFEGPDKSGKSTQAGLLARTLKSKGIPCVHTREPGGTGFAEAIRHILLDPKHEVEPLAELLLYEAARAQHTAERLRPALAAGRVVLSERYSLATDVYQGLARGLGTGLTRRLSRIATGGLEPDLTFVLDVPDREFSRRDRARRHDRLERESRAFRRRVREGYRRLARGRRRTVVLDGTQGADAVRAAIWRRVEPLLP